MKDAVVIVRHDGTDAIRVKEEKPWYKSGDAHVLRCIALHGSDETGVGTLTVKVSDTAVRVHKMKFPQHPSYSASYMLDIIAECQIGEYLDGLSGRFGEVKETPILKCSSEYVDKILKRGRAPDEVCLAYLTAKTWWAYKLGQYSAVFLYPDGLRLGVPIHELKVISEPFLKDRWDYNGEPQYDGFALVPTQTLKKLGPRLMGRAVTGPIFDVLTSFRSPRYKATETSLRKAYGFLTENNPDYPNAAKEAVAALESIARLITGTATLGKAVERLKQRGKIDSATADVLEAIYVYRNRTPGVGHGGKTAPSTEIEEARLIVNLCASASLFLLELDR